MQSLKMFGLVAAGALFVIAAPVERAQAVSLINPGAAQAVQDEVAPTTEVRWHWRRHHWRGHRWHHRRW
jgi:hypothetical protein